jgi:hypothetical protein
MMHIKNNTPLSLKTRLLPKCSGIALLGPTYITACIGFGRSLFFLVGPAWQIFEFWKKKNVALNIGMPNNSHVVDLVSPRDGDTAYNMLN